jgi:hypothetical protein
MNEENKMKWVIQSNLGNTDDTNKIGTICAKYGYSFEYVKAIPFSTDIPDIDNDLPTVFYGATNFINNIYLSKKWNPGTFFNSENFTVSSYIKNYKEHMLNFPCEFTTIGKFASSKQPDEKLFFIRPNKDLKEFPGDVVEFKEVVKWEEIIRGNNPNMSNETEIIVSEPYNIEHEWRVFECLTL